MSRFHVLEAFVALRRQVALLRAAEAADSGFGHNQIGVLYRLSLDSATMGELAEYASSDKASMTRTIAALEKQGLVKREACEKDGRSFHLHLTQKGKVKAKRAQEIRDAIGRKLDEQLSKAERESLSAIVDKIIAGQKN